MFVWTKNDVETKNNYFSTIKPVSKPTTLWRKKLKANGTIIVADFQRKTGTS